MQLTEIPMSTSFGLGTERKGGEHDRAHERLRTLDVTAPTHKWDGQCPRPYLHQIGALHLSRLECDARHYDTPTDMFGCQAEIFQGYKAKCKTWMLASSSLIRACTPISIFFMHT